MINHQSHCTRSQFRGRLLPLFANNLVFLLPYHDKYPVYNEQSIAIIDWDEGFLIKDKDHGSVCYPKNTTTDTNETSLD